MAQTRGGVGSFTGNPPPARLGQDSRRSLAAPPRLLYVVNIPSFFLSHRLVLAEAARAAGYDTHVAVSPGEGVEEIRAAGFPVHIFRLDRGGSNPLEDGRFLRALVRLYRSLRPTIVHHVTVKPVIYGSVAARLVGIPAVVNAVPGLGYVFLASGWRARLRRRAVLLAYRMAFRHPVMRAIFQNPDDLRLFLEAGLVSPGQARLIRGSGVDLDVFHATCEPPGNPVVMLPARMLWDKGVGEFVEAARRLVAQGVQARFVLVGGPDGNPAAVSEATLGAWADEGVVERWGVRHDMSAVLAQAHVVCLPSYREGLPKVLLEAAACARAIVATDVPGCREVVRDGHNGLLVAARDPAALAGALRRLIEDGETRQRFGAEGRRRAEAEFAVQDVVARTLEIYRELLVGEAPAVAGRAAPASGPMTSPGNMMTPWSNAPRRHDLPKAARRR